MKNLIQTCRNKKSQQLIEMSWSTFLDLSAKCLVNNLYRRCYALDVKEGGYELIADVLTSKKYLVTYMYWDNDKISLTDVHNAIKHTKLTMHKNNCQNEPLIIISKGNMSWKKKIHARMLGVIVFSGKNLKVFSKPKGKNSSALDYARFCKALN